jgi:hypothetical protein
MRLLGLAIIFVAIFACAAWAGDCGTCGQKHSCDQCAPKHECSSCTAVVSGDLCAGDCAEVAPCTECIELDKCCGKCERQREGCLAMPLPEDGCWTIDPECCPRECYRLLCVEREDFKLLCRRDCPKPVKCKSCQRERCETCEGGLELKSDLDQ